MSVFLTLRDSRGSLYKLISCDCSLRVTSAKVRGTDGPSKRHRRNVHGVSLVTLVGSATPKTSFATSLLVNGFTLPDHPGTWSF